MILTLPSVLLTEGLQAATVLFGVMLCGCCTQRGAFLAAAIVSLLATTFAIAALGQFDRSVDVIAVDDFFDDFPERGENSGGVALGAAIVILAFNCAVLALIAFACLDLLPACCECTCTSDPDESLGGAPGPGLLAAMVSRRPKCNHACWC